MWMLHGSCVSERPACSRSAGRLAASGAVPGAVEQVTSLAPEERRKGFVKEMSFKSGVKD